MSVSSWTDEELYRARFLELNKVKPYPYQVRLAKELTAGRNVCLRALTGSGKTKAVLTPFLAEGLTWERGRPARLIYALPLRSLVQQIHAEAQALLGRMGREAAEATIQTGEQPDDEFFDRGKIIVTTYDQVLSGLLGAPYGLSRSQRNLNAAAVAGTLVVFDEFHLMGLQSALLTGAAGLRLFDGLAQSVWMTATATTGPVAELARALGCTPLALSEPEAGALPVVATTRRELRREPEPLIAEAIRRHADGRTIVIVNTVERAQSLYREIEAWAGARGIPIRCLHARFFKPDRDERVGELRELFGPGKPGPAILIATQVVEAGVDISCDDLLTELCPMNALLQRAGRCARFPNERGVVHVFSLPPIERPWLPYGDRNGPDPALPATEAVLSEGEVWKMRPALVEEWVQRVHGEEDAAAIQQVGWRRRLDDVLDRLHRSVSQGSAGSVGELIRPDDQAQIRAIVATAEDRPESPARREALSVSRWTIARALRAGDSSDAAPAEDRDPVAWYWDLGAEVPDWRPLRTREELQLAYVVCLSPAIARYTSEVGLEVGVAGDRVSPNREPPERPGYGTLHRETWTAHTRGVVDYTERRWAREGDDGLAARGFAVRFGLSGGMMRAAVRAAALLHDVGKLQQPWQDWATRYQRARDASWVPGEPLAHTDYNAGDPSDRRLSRSIQPGRPAHAVASAWYGLTVLLPLLASIPDEDRTVVASACLAAIVAHHGGWIPESGKLEVKPLITGWETWVQRATGDRPAADAVRSLGTIRDPRAELEELLKESTGEQALGEWHALAAYLARVLRLSDRGATAEGGER